MKRWGCGSRNEFASSSDTIASKLSKLAWIVFPVTVVLKENWVDPLLAPVFKVYWYIGQFQHDSTETCKLVIQWSLILLSLNQLQLHVAEQVKSELCVKKYRFSTYHKRKTLIWPLHWVEIKIKHITLIHLKPYTKSDLHTFSSRTLLV